MPGLKSALVAAIGTVAIAGFATSFADHAAMAAQRTVPTGSVRFLHDPIPPRSVSRGAITSAGQKKQGWMLVPAVQMVRCASRKC